jgi:hypothetical protein
MPDMIREMFKISRYSLDLYEIQYEEKKPKERFYEKGRTAHFLCEEQEMSPCPFLPAFILLY